MTDIDRYGPWALIAGASEGIGEHAARQLAADGFSLVLLSRRQPVLDALRDSILAEDTAPGVEIRCLEIDLATPDAADRVVAGTADVDLGLCFYNAGADAVGVPFLDRPLDDVLGMVQRNVVTLSACCHGLGRRMRERGRGGIVVIGSGAGMAGAELITTYAATKAYQQNLCEGLWAELRPAVDVVCVVIATTATPAYLRSTAVPDEPGAMDPADVARRALGVLGTGPIRGASDKLEAGFRAMAQMPRDQLVEMMSAGVRHTFGVDA